jgi:LTXXQ motif family protein
MPHAAAPAPHIAAPAPHFAAPAAPRMAAPPPRMAAPAPHFSAPARVAAPHYAAPPRSFAARPAPHVAAPNRSYAQMPHGRGPQAQAQRFAPTSRQATIARTARELNRNAATKPPEVTKNVGSKPSEVTRNAPTPKAGPADNRTRQDLANKGQPLTGAKPGEGPTANLKGQNNLRGQNQAVPNRLSEGQQKLALADAARARVEQARKTPILKNPVFASTSPRAMGTSLSNWTFRGHFAQSAFFRDRDRHHRHIGIVLGFVGVAFWPYAYDDFVDYTFAPYAYDTFWPYAFDDVYAGIYGGYAPEYYAPVDAYAYAGSPSSERAYSRASRYPTTGANAPLAGGAARVCSGEAQGLTDFSIQKITDQVQPTQNQQTLLDDLRDATLKAVQILQAACPTDLPSTATGRLSAMRARVDAMLQAVWTVRPALDKFYSSLNDEQRARFNAMDQGEQQAAQAQGGDLDRLCKGQDSAQSRLPIDRIERTLRLSAPQQDGLKALDDATVRAAEILKSQCQSAATLTPTGRLAAMAERLTAMSKALETTQAALTNFYGSLSDEQKAQFDRINARRA